MDSLLSSYGIAIVYLWGSYRFPIFPPMGFLWSPLWIAYRSLWLPYGLPYVSYGFPYGSPTVFIPHSFFANFWGPQLGSGRLGGFWFPGGVVSEFKSPPPRRSSQPMTPSLPAPRYCPNRIFLRAGSLQSPIAFAAVDPKYPQKNPRRASRAGLLHFAMAFARRIAPFRYGLAAFEHKYPKFPRRASRAGLLNSPMFLAAFDHKYPKVFPGALCALDCFMFLLRVYCLGAPITPEIPRCASQFNAFLYFSATFPKMAPRSLHKL